MTLPERHSMDFKHVPCNRSSTGRTIFMSVVILFIAFASLVTLNAIRPPTISIQLRRLGDSPYDPRKLAFIVENRHSPILIPMLLQFIAVVPPEWRVQLMGSPEVIKAARNSSAVRTHYASGKLDLTYIPDEVHLGGQEDISRFLTSRSLVESLLPAEWVLVFQTDSIICANAQQSLNDFLDYDYVGAPWREGDRFGGNGGLSLRRVSAMLDVLQYQERAPGSEPEDIWWSYRLGQRVGARLANGTISSHFSQETSHPNWKPLGYHSGCSGKCLNGNIWGTYEKRKEVFDYCPEMKIFLQMEMKEYQDCGNDKPNWKREEYPIPPGLVAW